MKTKFALSGVTTLIVLMSMWCQIDSAWAKNNQQAQQAQAAQAQAARAMQAQQAQARSAQEQAMRSQMEQARQVQQQEQRAQQEAFQQREKALMVQEREARSAQEQTMRAQQDAARKAEEQNTRAQANQERAVEQQEKAQANEARRQQEQAVKDEQKAQREQRAEGPQTESRERREPIASTLDTTAGARNFERRPSTPPDLHVNQIPLEKAISMPVLEGNASANQREHFQNVIQNLHNHLVAVPMNQAPVNILATREAAWNNYLNNYSAQIAERQFIINRANTYCNIVNADMWPSWYQPDPNYTFCNGFTLGSTIQVGLDWLRFGWHPYFGPQPEGFICARDYIPTPWVYVPAYGLWRQAGINAWAPGGPGYDYGAPISVEVLEPRNLQVRDPYTGTIADRVINAIYMYNAYYYPESGRWGYVNRHNYFVWLNT